MHYTKLASRESVEKTKDALTAKGYMVDVVPSGARALGLIESLIPSGASVMNGASKTLEQIGFIDYLKTGNHNWDNLHAGILAESDSDKQAILRKQSVLSTYYLGSVHALCENGEFIIASSTGSQLAHVVYTSSHLIFVVSTKKIVPTMTDAFDRLEKQVIPLEDERMKAVYGVGTTLNKIVVFKGENQMLARKVHFILVEEDLGF